MTTTQFEALVEKLDEDARRNPAGYKLRVVLLALLGYGYVGLAVLVLLVLTLAAFASIVYLKVIGLKFAFVLLFFLILVLKAMWVRLAAPAGRVLSRNEAPPLFAMIDGLRCKLGAPRFHHVLITNDFNAAVVQVPRLGMFGWHRNYLLIGVPLMKSLTPEQLQAVLAHEFGHLAGGHAALSNWIYRLRAGWLRLVTVLEHQRSWGRFMFLPFFNWYAPYFNAYSFPLARSNEYEADAASGRLVSPKAAAEALTAVSVVGSYLDQKFWPEIHKQADDVPQPAFAPYAQMSSTLASALDDASTHRWLDQAMAQQTTVANTHPSLNDRLKALNERPRLSPPQPGGGADTLLGNAREAITAELDRRWAETILPSWEQRHREVQDGRKRLAELDRSAAGGELSLDEAFERAKLTESFGIGADAALEQFRQVHSRAGNQAVFCFVLAQRLLARDDATGVAIMERAMQLDQDAIAPGSEALRDYHWRAGRKGEAHAWNEKFMEQQELQHKAALERDTIKTSDKFEQHGLPAEVIAGLHAQLQAITELRKVYFVRKRVKHLTDKPFYILAFIITPWWGRHKAKVAAEIQQRIVASVQFPGETRIFSAEGENYHFGRTFRTMRGSRIL